MSAASELDQLGMTAVLSQDRMQATLCVPKGMDRSLLVAPYAVTILQDRGVLIDAKVQKAVTDFIENVPDSIEQRVEQVVASGSAPQPGRDGSIEWSVQEPEVPDVVEDEDHDYYAQSPFVLIESGDVLGVRHKPTFGQDGRTVTGQVLKARDGKEAPLRLDETILEDAHGNLVAQATGVLMREPGKASVRPLLQVQREVDFNTGHVDFDGDVEIGKGVKDNFQVTATGSVHIRGLVEMAHIKTGQDLILSRGFAGRDQGVAETGGDLMSTYLEEMHAVVHGQLKVARDIINCEVQVLGRVESPTATLMGGRLVAQDQVRLATIGSQGGVTTEIVVGSQPRLTALAGNLAALLARLEGLKARYQTEHDQLAVGGKNLTHDQRHRQAELLMEQQAIEFTIDRARQGRSDLTERIENERVVHVTAERALHPGVVFITPEREYRLHEAFRGPVTVTLDPDQGLMIGSGNAEPTPLTRYCEAQSAA